MRVYARCARERKKAGSIVDWASDAPLADDENGRGESEEGNRVTVRPMSSEPNEPTARRLPALKLRRHIITWSCVTRHSAFCRERVGVPPYLLLRAPSLDSPFSLLETSPTGPRCSYFERYIAVPYPFPTSHFASKVIDPRPAFLGLALHSIIIHTVRQDRLHMSKFQCESTYIYPCFSQVVGIPNRLVDNAPAPNLHPPTSPSLAVPRLESNVYTNTPLKSY